jgi:predicted molibdopterin-dependent oxidoreductase YjgC
MRPGKNGLDSRGILNAAADGKIECLILLGADPLADVPDADLARRALAGARRIIAVDTFINESSTLADVVLPGAAYAEKSGTTTNIEGRVTTLAHKVTVTGTCRPDWMIATDLAQRLGTDLGFVDVDDITTAIAAAVDGFEGVTPEALSASPNGLLSIWPATDAEPVQRAAVADRIAYNFRLVVSRRLYDKAVGTAKSPSLAALAPGGAVFVHPLDVAHVGSPIGADVKVSTSRATIVLPLAADESVQRGTAWIPFNQAGASAGELIDAAAAVTDVRIESL